MLRRNFHAGERVIYSPYGAYYASDGRVYPWTTTQPRRYMPYLVD
jgi:hypothetical protein